MAAKKKVSKRRTSKKKVAKKRVTKKKTVRRRATAPKKNKIAARRVVDHMIIAEMREAKQAAARRKGLTFDKRLYFDGAGWSKNTHNAARYHNRGHAVKIAQLIADSGSHNDNLRQLAVIEDTAHPK